MADSKTLYLLDGTAQLYRAYFAVRGLTTAQGFPTNALFGFTSMLRKLIADERPTHLGVTFDLPVKTFRHERYPAYKANRPPTPEDMKQQAPYASKICAALGVPVLQLEGFEADDLIATYTRLGREAGYDIVIVSSDKDLLQLVGEGVTVLNPSKDLRLDPAGVAAQFGVPPGQVLDVLALMGDSVDNIPGVPGVGEKTALSIVATYGGLDAVLERADRFVALYDARDRLLAAIEAIEKVDAIEQVASEAISGSAKDMALTLERFLGAELDVAWPDRLAPLRQALGEEALHHVSGRVGRPGKTAMKPLRALKRELKGLDRKSARKSWYAIAANVEQAKLSRELATLNDRAPDAHDVDDLALGEMNRDDALELFGFLEFTAQIAELESGTNPVAAPKRHETHYVTFEDLTAVQTAVNACRAVGACAIDWVAGPGDPMTSDLIGLALAWGDGHAGYLPLGHTYLTAPPALAESELVASLGALLADGSVAKHAHDLKTLDHLLRRRGLAVENWGLDTKLAAFVLHSGRSNYALSTLAETYLGRTLTPRDELTGTGTKRRGFDEVEVDAATAYLAATADAVFDMAARLRADLDEGELARLYDEMDAPLLPLLAQMEQRGIRIDVDRLATMSAEMDGRLQTLTTEIHTQAGHEFNVDSPKQLREVLFDELGLKPGKKTAKSKVASTDAQTLEELDHPIAAKLLVYRELSKLKGTYVDALPRLVHSDTGRVHTSYQPTGAATGRLSSNDPNLQNIPARTAEGRRIRSAFVPAEGMLFLASDYSQVELRVLAHLTGDEELTAAFQAGEDIHRYTAAQVFGVVPDLVTDSMRTSAKAVNFGILYGMSEFRLAREQGMKRAEAKRFIQIYFERFARVRDYIETVREQALRDGAVRTLFGRVRWFPQLRQRISRVAQEQALRAAVNTTIQGTAADLMKMAMLAVDRELTAAGSGARVLLQVHDELLLEVPEGEIDETAVTVRGAMEDVHPFTVPLAVDQKTGQSWEEVT
jgi:DNA polymerase-1